MESNDEAAPKLTQIKYEKTSCYFCNEWLDTQSFKEHIIHCGQVLEKCPHSCSSYVPRKRMNSHLKTCPKVRSGATNGETKPDLSEYENRILILEQDISALRSVLNEEIKQRLHLITDVGSLRKHNQISEEWTQKVGDVLSALKKCINEERAARCSELKKFGEDMQNIYHQLQQIHNWQMATSSRIDQIHNKLIEEENVREQIISTIENKSKFSENSVFTLTEEMEELQQQLSKMSVKASQSAEQISMEILRFEELLKEREEQERTMQQDLQTAFETIQLDLQSKFVSNSELSTKQTTLDYEVKSMKNIVCNTEDKCDKLGKVVEEADRTIHGTKQALADLEVHLLYQNKLLGIHNTRGHLIWRIDDYSGKLLDAKEHETCLQSPMFCNKQYGYTLRLDVHLNGIGNWKGRNVIACLNVVPGEYDTLLPWPCKLEADIILKDQPPDLSQAQDYLRNLIVKKKNEEYDINQYIHIPHKIISSRNYLRNNAIILEVRVHKVRGGS